MLTSLMTGDLVAARQAELLVAAEDERLAIRMRRARRAERRSAATTRVRRTEGVSPHGLAAPGRRPAALSSSPVQLWHRLLPSRAGRRLATAGIHRQLRDTP